MPKKKTKEEFLKKYSGKQNPIPNIFSKKKQKQGASQGKPFKKKKKGKYGGDIPARKEVPGNPHGVTKKDQEGNIILMAKDGGSASKFPDLSGDGKVTQKDILMGRGVIERKRGGSASKDRKTKTEAYRKLGKQKYDKGMTPDIGEKGRKSFKKTRVKKKDLVDIAGVIKSTGDRYLGKLGNLKTRFKDKKTAKAAGVKFKAKGGLAGRLATRGYGKAKK